MFFSGYKSDMTGTKACSIESYCKEQNISFTKFDYFGHGASDGEFTEGTIKRWLKDSLLIFDNITTGNQILIGSSMGSWIMFLLASLRKERVAGLIGIASAPDFTKVFWKNANKNIKKRLLDKGIYFQNSLYSNEKTPITLRFIKDSKNFYILDKKIKINCPIRLIHGLKDIDVSYKSSIELSRNVYSSNLSLYFLPDGDHRLSGTKEINLITKLIMELYSSI